MIARSGAILSFALLVAAAPAAPPTPDRTRNYVSTAREATPGVVTIVLFDENQLFFTPKLAAERRVALFAFLQDAVDAMHQVILAYRGDQATVSNDEDAVAFPLCTVELDGRRFDVDPCLGSNPPSSDAMLGLAFAALNRNEHGRARALASETLAAPGTDDRRRRLALTVRAEALSLEAYDAPTASDAQDRANAAALADTRALIAAAPHNVEWRFAAARLFEELGGFTEARRTYAEILKDWPDQDFRATIRLAAIDRREGHYADALATLDRLAGRTGTDLGMKFHYHRAWTLTLMKRYDAAIADLTQGLATQPDYAGAHIRRACAYGSLGRHPEALADLGRAEGEYRAIVGGETDPSVQSDLKRIAEVSMLLKARIAARNRTPLVDACRGYTGYDEIARSRSPLLPPIA